MQGARAYKVTQPRYSAFFPLWLCCAALGMLYSMAKNHWQSQKVPKTRLFALPMFVYLLSLTHPALPCETQLTHCMQCCPALYAAALAFSRIIPEIRASPSLPHRVLEILQAKIMIWWKQKQAARQYVAAMSAPVCSPLLHKVQCWLTSTLVHR